MTPCLVAAVVGHILPACLGFQFQEMRATFYIDQLKPIPTGINLHSLSPFLLVGAVADQITHGQSFIQLQSMGSISYGSHLQNRYTTCRDGEEAQGNLIPSTN